MCAWKVIVIGSFRLIQQSQQMESVWLWIQFKRFNNASSIVWHGGNTFISVSSHRQLNRSETEQSWGKTIHKSKWVARRVASHQKNTLQRSTIAKWSSVGKSTNQLSSCRETVRTHKRNSEIRREYFKIIKFQKKAALHYVEASIFFFENHRNRKKCNDRCLCYFCSFFFYYFFNSFSFKWWETDKKRQIFIFFFLFVEFIRIFLHQIKLSDSNIFAKNCFFFFSFAGCSKNRLFFSHHSNKLIVNYLLIYFVVLFVVNSRFLFHE